MQTVAAYQKMRKPDEIPKQTGHFISIDSRKEVAKELKRTHFVLGSDTGSLINNLILYIVDFQSKILEEKKDANWNVAQSQETNKIANMIKQSHIQIGMNNKVLMETTNNKDYDRKSVD